MTDNNKLFVKQLNCKEPNEVKKFLEIGLDYLSEVDNIPIETNKKFLKSILRKLFGKDRWLLLLIRENQYIGFLHAKIDTEDKPGWGYILEFYIIPGMRRKGYGSFLYKRIRGIFASKNITKIWLTASPYSELFWEKVGFYDSGEKENGFKVMMCKHS